jgi:hypothetical protein
MKIQILAQSDSSIKKWEEAEFFIFLDQILKIDILGFDRILQFSPILLDISRRGTSQTIENYFLYKKALIRLFFKYFLYEKGTKTEKIKVVISVMNFSIIGEIIVKVRGPRLKF